MREGPFPFLRATFYRWGQRWPFDLTRWLPAGTAGGRVAREAKAAGVRTGLVAGAERAHGRGWLALASHRARAVLGHDFEAWRGAGRGRG